ncbi:MucR family transcriptional regulator [Shinella sp. G-2]|uniref:MucR family transcriptional regulator n=1 Tax=Shinella sp. G-2 TaxID=3133141 RepID=UPI003D0113AC
MDHKTSTPPMDATIASLTAIVVAYLERNEISPSDLPQLVARLQCVLHNGHDIQKASLVEGTAMQSVAIANTESSIQEDYLVCLEDGKRFKSLKRHLQTKYNMTPDDYRRKWNLAPDYPMVAPAYAQARSEIARSVGLGVTISRHGGKYRPKT